MVKGLSFEIKDRSFSTFGDAAEFAIAHSASTGEKVEIDVIALSRSAAKAWGGNHGVEEYDEDPEASVHDRIVVQAKSLGRIA